MKDSTEVDIWNHPLLTSFHAGQRKWLAKRLKKISLEKGDRLFKQGETVTGIYLHMKGLAKITQKDRQGQIEFSRLVLPGDTSGHRSLFIESTYKGTAEALSDQLEVMFLSLEDVTLLLSKSISFTKNIITKISKELSRTEEEIVLKKKKSVRERVADLIYHLCLNYAEQVGENEFVIKSEISKREIAKILLVSNETVIRVMSEMKSDNIIAYQKKRLRIRQLDQLSKIANA